MVPSKKWETRHGHLVVLYTMDHEVVPRPCKICDWLLNSFQDHFGLQKGQNVRVTMEFKLPEWHILGLHYPLTWSNMFCGGRAAMVEKRQGPIVEKWCYNKIWMIFFLVEEKMKTREDNKLVKLEFFQTCPFWAYIKKINTFIIWCMVISLGPRSIYTYWRTPKALEMDFSKNQIMKVGPWEKAIICGPISWSMV